MSFSNSIATSLLKQPIICTIVLILSFSIIEAQLSSDHYSYSCPNALDIVNEVVVEAIKNETRLGASLLRLHFHDCFVNGCDGSVLLDDNGTFTGEKTALPNNHSLRGFHVIDVIKAKLESACPNVVSCADILAIVARDAVYNLGGPSWEVQLGRRDSVTANQTEANLVIPAPFSNLTVLISNFAAVGLSLEDLVALSGAHTIGFARCNIFRQRIYGDVDINPTFADSLRKICPRNGSDNVLQGLDAKTPSHFDNLYYKNLLIKKGLLHSDQELYSGKEADPIVRTFSRDVTKFFDSFAKAMIKMGDISPLTGSNGEIRRHCRRSNKKP